MTQQEIPFEQMVQGMAQLVKGLVAVVLETGDRGIPAGHLYAHLMTHNVTLGQYERLEDLMLKTGLVEKSPSHLLKGSKAALDAVKARSASHTLLQEKANG